MTDTLESWPFFEIDLSRLPGASADASITVQAADIEAAVKYVWDAYREVRPYFNDDEFDLFQSHLTARLVSQPAHANSSYDFIALKYGVRVHIGERVKVQTAKGIREGWILYPNVSTEHRVHVLLDGDNAGRRYHPGDLIMTPLHSQTASDAGFGMRG